MFTLIFDTSTERGFVSIAQENTLLFVKMLPFGLQNSRFLLSTIQLGLKEVGLNPSQLSAIGVGVGPGSFTGIRVGAATAKGLAYPYQLPLIGFNSLSGFIGEKEGLFASVIDARVGGAYVLIQKRNGSTIEVVKEPFLCPLSELQETLKDCSCTLGPYFGPQIQKLAIPNMQEKDPDLSHLANHVFERFSQNDYSLNSQLPIIYLNTPAYS